MVLACRIVTAGLLLLVVLAGCATVIAVAITADRAGTDQAEVALGWGIERDERDHVVRWRECTSATECTTVMHERSRDLEAIDVVGSATVETPYGRAKTVEVDRLHFGRLAPNRLTAETQVRARMDQAAAPHGHGP